MIETSPAPSNRNSSIRLLIWFAGIIAFTLILFLLVQARFILASLVFALLIFSLTTQAISAVSRMQLGRLRLATWMASTIAFTIIAVLLLGVSVLLVSQVNMVVGSAAALSNQAINGLSELAGWFSPGAEASVEAAIRSIQISRYLGSMASQASSLLSASVLVILFVGFMFAERLWFPQKLSNLLGSPERAAGVTEVIATIVRAINRYLLVKSVISAVTTAVVYLLARTFGLDLAMPIAVITFVLNFVPSIGSIIATVILGLLALIQLDPTAALTIFCLAGIAQFALGSVIDPMLMGQTLRISSFGILISLAFWGAIWGVAGMFLAVPIMVAIKMTCAQIPAMRPLAILLSRDGTLEA